MPATPAPQHFSLTTEWKQQFRAQLKRWYKTNSRDLPWRASQDPYKIWVSEIMLQQTQVETVKSYFQRFTSQFPTVQSLASASESEVLKLWEGLGYYRRARQLHKAAQVVVAEHDGKFPTDFDDVLALPGIGRYTAGAITSISFDQRQPIVEANTIRLFSRLIGYAEDPRAAQGQKTLWSFAEEVLPRKNVGTFNQALMELGSLVCEPANPKCDICPVLEQCKAKELGLVSQIPKLAKKIKYEEITEIAVVIHRKGKVLVRQCGETERWAGLWDFVRFASDIHDPVAKSLTVKQNLAMKKEIAEQAKALAGIEVTGSEAFAMFKHGVTKYRITLRCYEAEYKAGKSRSTPTQKWVPVDSLNDYPLSVTGRKIAKVLTKRDLALFV